MSRSTSTNFEIEATITAEQWALLCVLEQRAHHTGCRVIEFHPECQASMIRPTRRGAAAATNSQAIGTVEIAANGIGSMATWVPWSAA